MRSLIIIILWLAFALTVALARLAEDPVDPFAVPPPAAPASHQPVHCRVSCLG
jgi:hypothetical protein